jgi:hypothetical protein
MDRIRTVARLSCLMVAAAVAVAGCTSSTGVEPPEIFASDGIEARVGAGVTFLVMKVTPEAHMDALFEGRVVADDAGCLRLDGPDPATVVWPQGTAYEEANGGSVRIVREDGEVVGSVGGAFALGGGEVPSLHDGLGFTQADRDLAEAHCPGRYWIVAPE